jgi:hypothetical protein
MSIGGSCRNSSCMSRPVLRRFGGTPCGTRSAIGLPLRVTVKLSPASTRRMISALSLRSSR